MLASFPVSLYSGPGFNFFHTYFTMCEKKKLGSRDWERGYVFVTTSSVHVHVHVHVAKDVHVPYDVPLLTCRVHIPSACIAYMSLCPPTRPLQHVEERRVTDEKRQAAETRRKEELERREREVTARLVEIPQYTIYILNLLQ